MSDVYIYQCGSCLTRYANLPGMSIRCPECRSKERELILSESILDLAKRFIDLQKLKGIITEEMIEDAQTESGGWTKETLAGWGVPWPPPKGWKEQLLKTGIPYHREP